MSRFINILLSIIVICSCSSSGSKSGKKNDSEPNYFDRIMSEYSTMDGGIDQKIVLKRETKEYQVYSRATMYNGNWELEDEGHYKESIDNNSIVTCDLDNAKLKREDNERLGSIFRVEICLKTRTATFVSIAGDSYANDITH